MESRELEIDKEQFNTVAERLTMSSITLREIKNQTSVRYNISAVIAVLINGYLM